MRKNALKFVVLTLLGIMIYSCQNENDLTTQIEEPINLNEQDGLKKMILGKKLENPYSVENMKKALNNLKQSKSFAKRKGTSDNLEITTTHLYIRFKPVNEEELNLIERDTTLILFDHPMDYEISEEGDFYQDPEIPDESPTYQYTSVEVDKELPNVPYEILANLYIPYDENEDNDIEDEDTFSKSTTQLNEKKIFCILEEEALRITGNLEKEESTTTLQRCWFCGPKKWQPKGKITLWDTTLGRYIGVEGVKVRAGRWFKWRHSITKADGSYAFASRFRRSVRYKMDWERYDFALRSGFWASAQYRGPYKKGDWNWQIRNGDRHQYYGTIFQAAYDFYYGNRFGLKSPKRNSRWKSKLRIRAIRESGTSSHHNGRSRFGLISDIYLKAYDTKSGKNKSAIFYGTTIHELAHSSHRELDKEDYRKLVWKGYLNPETWGHTAPHLTQEARSARRLMETWAKTIELKFVYHRYHNKYDISDYGYSKTFASYDYSYVNDTRKWRTEENDYTLIYTSAGIDMMDSENQRFDARNNINYTQDRVKGYTINQLERAMINATSWGEWKSNLKSLYNNPTEKYLDELFANWKK
jgi:hypothetical protein